MKTFKTPIYDNIEFAFTTSTYSTTGNTYVGIHSKKNDCIEPYCNLTVNLDMQLGKGLAFIDVNGRTGLYLSHGRNEALRVCRLSPLSAQPR